MVIRIAFDRTSLENAAQQLEAAAAELDRKMKEVCVRLAEKGAARAEFDYAAVPLALERNDVVVTTEETAKGAKIIASGETVLFLEFGAGARVGYGHPDPRNYGPGTYPGKGHWDDPKGWWIPKEHGGGHTYGNPPMMGMYNATQEIRAKAQEVADEVFAR